MNEQGLLQSLIKMELRLPRRCEVGDKCGSSCTSKTER